MKILIIEDHPKIRENVVRYFKKQGFVAESGVNGLEGLEKANTGEYDCIVLDMNMPVMNGQEFLRIFRENNTFTPIIALTSNVLLDDKVDAYSQGVDDYLTKPFELRELELRIHALTKRKQVARTEVIVAGSFRIHPDTRKVYWKSTEISCSQKEFGILEYLGSNLGIPKTKTDILVHVWGESSDTLDYASTTLEAHISMLRKKTSPSSIETVRGVGYIISSES